MSLSFRLTCYPSWQVKFSCLQRIPLDPLGTTRNFPSTLKRTANRVPSCKEALMMPTCLSLWTLTSLARMVTTVASQANAKNSMISRIFMAAAMTPPSIAKSASSPWTPSRRFPRRRLATWDALNAPLTYSIAMSADPRSKYFTKAVLMWVLTRWVCSVSLVTRLSSSIVRIFWPCQIPFLLWWSPPTLSSQTRVKALLCSPSSRVLQRRLSSTTSGRPVQLAASLSLKKLIS